MKNTFCCLLLIFFVSVASMTLAMEIEEKKDSGFDPCGIKLRITNPPQESEILCLCKIECTNQELVKTNLERGKIEANCFMKKPEEEQFLNDTEFRSVVGAVCMEALRNFVKRDIFADFIKKDKEGKKLLTETKVCFCSDENDSKDEQ